MVIACVCAKPKPNVIAYSAPIVATQLATNAVVSSELPFDISELHECKCTYKFCYLFLNKNKTGEFYGYTAPYVDAYTYPYASAYSAPYVAAAPYSAYTSTVLL